MGNREKLQMSHIFYKRNPVGKQNSMVSMFLGTWNLDSASIDSHQLHTGISQPLKGPGRKIWALRIFFSAVAAAVSQIAQDNGFFRNSPDSFCGFLYLLQRNLHTFLYMSEIQKHSLAKTDFQRQGSKITAVRKKVVRNLYMCGNVRDHGNLAHDIPLALKADHILVDGFRPDGFHRKPAGGMFRVNDVCQINKCGHGNLL
jgi:hypothetical protein